MNIYKHNGVMFLTLFTNEKFVILFSDDVIFECLFAYSPVLTGRPKDALGCVQCFVHGHYDVYHYVSQ